MVVFLVIGAVITLIVGLSSSICAWKYADYPYWPDAGAWGIILGLLSLIMVIIIITGLLAPPGILAIVGCLITIVASCLFTFLVRCIWWESILYGFLTGFGVAVIPPLFLLTLGFGCGGIIAGSCAAACQGPAVAAESCFACFQGCGATMCACV